MKTRIEIVEKQEQLYDLRKKEYLPVDYVNFITDILDWVLDENDFLKDEKLTENVAFFTSMQDAVKNLQTDNETTKMDVDKMFEEIDSQCKS